MNREEIKYLKELYKFMSNKGTVRVVDFLKENPHATVTEIYIKLRTTQPEVSRILRGLRNHSFVQVTKDGKLRHYRINALAMFNFTNVTTVVCNSIRRY